MPAPINGCAAGHRAYDAAALAKAAKIMWASASATKNAKGSSSLIPRTNSPRC